MCRGRMIIFMVLLLSISLPVIAFGAAGDLDTTFNPPNGFILYNGEDVHGYAVAIQQDGKIVVTGYSHIGSNIDVLVLRYNSNGTLDTTFGGGDGVVTYDSGDYDGGNAVAIQQDGKIVVVGTSSNGTNYDALVLRYNSNGTLDTSFGGGDGYVTYDSGYSDYGNAVAIQQDGKIVVVGESSVTGYDALVLRYNSNGTLDTTFGGGDGVVTYDSGDYDGVAIQQDGKIVVTGYSNNNVLVLRYNSNGTLDTSFGGGDGIVTYNSGNDDVGRAVAIHQDGKIVVTGYISYGWYGCDAFVLRYNSNGTLDTTFGGGDGIVTYDNSGSPDWGRAVAIQQDGKIVVVGDSSNGSSYGVLTMRLIGGQLAETLSISKTGTGSGTVTSAPSGILCGWECSASYASGINVTLTSTPDNGSTFAGWSGGGCTGTAPKCTVKMDAAKNVTAKFNGTPLYSLADLKGTWRLNSVCP